MKMPLLVSIILLLLLPAATSLAAGSAPRNVVLIMADDIGIECFGCYGGTSYKTPNMDHRYKLFSDRRMYAIDRVALKEEPLDLSVLTPEAEAARKKLEAAIAEMMQEPMSDAARVEVDAFGVPLGK